MASQQHPDAERLLRQIDERLRDEGVVIPDRPAAALAVLRQGQEPRQRASLLQPHIVRDWYEKHYRGALGEPELRIRNDNEFDNAMAKVDDLLREQGVPVPGRPLSALQELARRLKDEPPVTLSRKEARPGRYTGVDLSIRVKRWYDERYGNKINMLRSLGSIVILVRSEPWEFRAPLTHGPGTTRYVCEWGVKSTLPTEPHVIPTGAPVPPPPVYNILDSVIGLPDSVKQSLDDGERREILEAFLAGRGALEAVRIAAKEPLVVALSGDLRTSAERLVATHPHPGLSKWASLQAVEKAFKAYLEEKGQSYERRHNLTRLADLAEEAGLPTVPRPWLQEIQCPAGVRYGDPAVTIGEAVAAHLAALRVVAVVASQLRPLRPSKRERSQKRP